MASRYPYVQTKPCIQWNFEQRCFKSLVPSRYGSISTFTPCGLFCFSFQNVGGFLSAFCEVVLCDCKLMLVTTTLRIEEMIMEIRFSKVSAHYFVVTDWWERRRKGIISFSKNEPQNFKEIFPNNSFSTLSLVSFSPSVRVCVCALLVLGLCISTWRIAFMMWLVGVKNKLWRYPKQTDKRSCHDKKSNQYEISDMEENFSSNLTILLFFVIFFQSANGIFSPNCTLNFVVSRAWQFF